MNKGWLDYWFCVWTMQLYFLPTSYKSDTVFLPFLFLHLQVISINLRHHFLLSFDVYPWLKKDQLGKRANILSLFLPLRPDLVLLLYWWPWKNGIRDKIFPFQQNKRFCVVEVDQWHTKEVFCVGFISDLFCLRGIGDMFADRTHFSFEKDLARFFNPLSFKASNLYFILLHF